MSRKIIRILIIITTIILLGFVFIQFLWTRQDSEISIIKNQIIKTQNWYIEELINLDKNCEVKTRKLIKIVIQDYGKLKLFIDENIDNVLEEKELFEFLFNKEFSWEVYFKDDQPMLTIAGVIPLKIIEMNQDGLQIVLENEWSLFYEKHKITITSKPEWYCPILKRDYLPHMGIPIMYSDESKIKEIIEPFGKKSQFYNCEKIVWVSEFSFYDPEFETKFQEYIVQDLHDTINTKIFNDWLTKYKDFLRIK